MTKTEILSTDRLFLMADDIAELLETRPQDLRARIRADGGERVFGFHCAILGNRIKIPTEQFITFMGWRKDN